MEDLRGKDATLDIVADITCPWCFIGKKRLETALSMLPHLDIDLRWRPFQLDPNLPEKGAAYRSHMTKKFKGEDSAYQAEIQVKEAGAAEDIFFAFDLIEKAPNTLKAHQLIRWAGRFGDQSLIVETLFNAYFMEGLDVGNEQMLVSLGEDTGLDGDIIQQLYDEKDDLQAVRDEIAHAGKLGVTGVPCFILNNTYALMGAQEPETLVQAIEQAVQAGA